MQSIRRFLAIGICATALVGLLPAADGQTRYPERPVRILVGFPPGQATDMVARMFAERLTQALGQPVIVENRPGAGGSIALAALAKLPPDGYTMMLSATASLVTNPHLYKSVGYDTLKDFEPVALVAELPLLMVATASAPFDTFPQFIAYAKANPGKLNYSSSGNGTLSHLAMELLKRDAGLSLTHVPYQGSVKAMTDLVAGNVTVGFDTIAVTKPHIDSNRLKLLAAASDKRIPLMPEVPTVAEAGFTGFVASAWLGVVFPRGTPSEIVNRVSTELQRAVGDPAVQKTMATLGAVPRSSSAAEFTRVLATEYERWGRIVRESGAKMD